MPKFNPFRPGSIIHPGMFSGRIDELRLLENALSQTAHGNASHFLIHGERGIGKSSLLLLLNATAAGRVKGLDDATFSFITVNVELEPRDDYKELILKVARELQRQLDRDEKVKAKLKNLWDFITRWKIMGVEYQRDQTPATAMLEELADKIVAVASNLHDEKQGIYIFIDEADKAPVEAGLGEFTKILTERLTKNGACNVGIGLSGISDVLQKMRASHESSVRVFTPLLLAPLDPEDRKTVVRRGLEEARETNGFETTITSEALDLIADLSEGYPHFIQQYAYSAFDHDADNNIDAADVRQALTKENGALHLLGQRYFENMYTDELRSDDYRTVLQVLANHMPEALTRQQIGAEAGLKPHTVNNALTACTKRGSVVQISGKAGHYCLPSRSFAAWIQAFKSAKQ